MCLLSGGVLGRTKNYLLSGPMAQVCEAHPPLRRNLGIHSCYVSSVEQKTEQDAKGFKACLVCVCVCLRVAEKLSPTNTGGPIFGQFQTFTSIEVNDLSLGHSFQSTACVREYNTAKRVFKAPTQVRPKACLCVFVYVVRPVRGFPNVSLARCSWANEELRT